MLRSLFGGFARRRSSGRTRSSHGRSSRMNLERLEQRRLLAIDCFVSVPADGGENDMDDTTDAVWVDTTQEEFRIKFEDAAGVDDDSADNANNVRLYKDGTLLTVGAGNDYTFDYHEGLDEMELESVGGDFGVGKYTINVEGVKNSSQQLMVPDEFRVQIGTIDNIILFIGDGMGTEHIDVLEAYQDATVFFDDPANFPFTTSIDTDSDTGGATDSAAAATAMATGVSVSNGAVSYEGGDLLTSLEIYKAAGKRTGLITSAFLSHATPAAFAAHNADRNEYEEIKDDMLATLPNVVMGGAWKYTEEEADDYYRNDGDPAVAETETEMRDTDIIDPDEDELACGLFPEYPDGEFYYQHYMPYMHSGGAFYPPNVYPTLSEMTDLARDLLDEGSDGFFLMVEGGRIDHASHMSNGNELLKTTYMVKELDEFEAAVSAVYTWASSRTDTLIIVTADHETGDLQPFDPDEDEWNQAHWHSTGHTDANVDCFGWGVGADALQGKDLFQNEHIFRITTPDTTAPTATLVDADPSAFEIQLSDDATGRGIDDSTVDAATLVFKRGYTTLVKDTDYNWAYDTETDKITLTKTGGGDFAYGEYTITFNSGTNKITDYGVPANELPKTTLRLGATGFGSGVLYVSGTMGNDTITIAADAGKVTVNGSELDPTVNASSVNYIRVYGYAGNDPISLQGVSTNDYSNLSYTRIYAGTGIDTITGSPVKDYIYGDDGNDVISAGGGDDRLYGEAGNDSLTGGADNDWYYFIGSGDLGSDSITDSGGSNDALSFSGAGSAVDLVLGQTTLQEDVLVDKLDLTINSTIERVYGSSHDDTIAGSSSADYISGGSGDDSILAGGGHDTVYAGDGQDTVYGEADNDDLYGGLDDEYGYGDYLYGGTGTDELHGDDGYESGYGGGDYLDGGEHADCLFGEDGSDTLVGGAGDDYLNGGEWSDCYRFTGTSALGTDQIEEDSGNEDNDYLYFYGLDLNQQGIELDIGDYEEQELLTGLSLEISNTTLIEKVYGTEFDDTIKGNSNDNYLYGYQGADEIRGEGGDDTLIGSTGNDTLYAGTGVDRLYGYAGADVFWLDDGDGDDYAHGGDDSDTDTAHSDAGDTLVYFP